MKKPLFGIDADKRILLGCHEIPGYGGASTAGYKLFETMQQDGFNVFYINLIGEQDEGYFRYMFGENLGNPKGLPNVYNCSVNGSDYTPHKELVDIINNISPDVLVSVGWIAALLMKRAAPEKRSIFLTSGSQRLKDNIINGKVKDFITLNEHLQRPNNNSGLLNSVFEKEATKISNLIITHSYMIKGLQQRFFPSYTDKIYSDVIWFAEWIYKDALNYSGLKRPFYERDIDVLFVASSWSRPEKNYKLVKEIVSNSKGLNIHIVGEVKEKLAGAECHGLVVRREDLFGLMGRAKTVVCPSLFDAAPGILFESSAMGCNMVASKNCGNWEICNETLLVDPFKLDNFVEKIRLSLLKKYEDNMEYFIRADSYKNLIETISVF